MQLSHTQKLKRTLIVTASLAPALLCGAPTADEAALPVRKTETAQGEKSAESKASALSRLKMASQGNVYSSPSPAKAAAPKAEVKKESSAASESKKSSTEPARKTSVSSDAKKVSAKAPAASEKKTVSTRSRETASDKKPAAAADDLAIENLSPKKTKGAASAKPSKDSGEESSGKSSSEEAKPAKETVSAPTVNDEPPALEESAYSASALQKALPEDVQVDGTGPSATRATVPAPGAFAPNTYGTSPAPKTGFLSRLFSRQRQAAPTTGRTQSAFSSDYATRGSSILPTVIDGKGFNGADLPIGYEDNYRLASLPSDFRPTDLVQLPMDCCHYGNQLYLRREAAAALNNMINAAAREGYTIRVVSAYRDYGHQSRLYTQAVARGGSDQKSVARPGKSEHHLGTTVDLTNDEKHALSRSFGDTPEGRWLGANAHRFGWKMTVMAGNGRRSHNDEPWHLRYLGNCVDLPLASRIAGTAPQQPQRRTSILSSVAHVLTLGRK